MWENQLSARNTTPTRLNIQRTKKIVRIKYGKAYFNARESRGHLIWILYYVTIEELNKMANGKIQVLLSKSESVKTY